VQDAAAIRDLLVRQVTGSVRWRESVAFMAEAGVTEAWEVGAGKALSGMLRRTAPTIAVRAVGTPRRPAPPRPPCNKDASHVRPDRQDRPRHRRLGGLGAAIARALHGAGATVGLHGTRTEPLEALKSQLGDRAHVLPADLSNPEALAALPKQAEAAMGSVNVLVNNAGTTRDNLFIRMSDEDWDRVIAVNLTPSRGSPRPRSAA
jgi:hypothetical protein